MFQPVVPMSGLPGWVFLNKTMERQTEIFNASPTITRDTDYFEQKIGAITTAEELVSDRRLLRVALGAFGLQDDIDSRALIRKVLEEGTRSEDALANKLSDPRYKELAEAFGFDRLTGPRTRIAGFGAEITTQFRARAFEVAVGDQDQALRLALNARRELAEMATSSETENAKWFGIMGQPPLRKVFETVLGLPSSFAQLDLDRQLTEFKSRANSQLGIDTIDDLADADILDKLVERFLLRDQVSGFGSMSSNSIALTLLQAAMPQEG